MDEERIGVRYRRPKSLGGDRVRSTPGRTVRDPMNAGTACYRDRSAEMEFALPPVTQGEMAGDER